MGEYVMKRRYKLLIIIITGAILTFVINSFTKEEKIYFTALGDGIALGMTPYDMVGYSFNDYYEESLSSKRKLANYNNEFIEQDLTIEKLQEDLEKNIRGEKTNIPIKQTLAKANIITIAIGMDEMIDYTVKNKLDDERIDEYIKRYEIFLNNVRTFNDNDIVIIGLYSDYNFDKNTVYDINNRLKEMAFKYDCQFLDISAIALNQDYHLNTSYYLNYKGQQAIYKQIKKILHN